MAWFKVDDGLHNHRKTRKVRRSHHEKRRDVSPFGLWVLAGSWCGGSGTGGFIPTEVLEEWDDDAVALADRLVDAGLWWETRVEGEPGYGFHDWQDYVPRIDGIPDASESGRRGNHVRWHEKRGETDPDCEFCTGMDRPDVGAIIAPMHRPESGQASPPNREPVPTRPDPTQSCSSADAESEFASWYLAYPRKVGKGQATKAYIGARKKASADVLLDAIKRQAPSLMAKGVEFCPYPATWLNGERWADEVVPAARSDLQPVGEITTPPDGLNDVEYRKWFINQRKAK